MFTGIIQNQGNVVKKESLGRQVRFFIRMAKKEKRKLEPGESIAVNGVCLTARRCSSQGFEADVIRETLEATTLGSLKPGSKVNLERSLRLGDSLGGHFVTGHVDEVARIIHIERAGNNRTFSIRAGKKILTLIASKGSVTVDGISLTVQKVRGSVFEVGLVPHTLKETSLGEKKSGDAVNLEADLIARYLSLCGPILKRSQKMTQKKLKQQGF